MIIGEKLSLSLSHRGEGDKDVKRLFLEMLPSIVEISILNISFTSQNDCEFESRLISKLLGICECNLFESYFLNVDIHHRLRKQNPGVN